MTDKKGQEYTKEDILWAKKTLECRNIVNVINDYEAFDEFKRAKVIELLAFELENREESIKIIELSRMILEKTQSKNKKIIEL
jgi:hypothetical protein